MAEQDPLATQSSIVPVAAELAAVGLTDPDEIGHGGFGVVYRCWQRALDRAVAVKVLTADLDDGNVERFVREQHAMGRLSGHPNIVTVFEVGKTAGGHPFIVMQYQPRGTLDSLIRKRGPLDAPAALRLGIKIAGALETAHQAGVLHRDVKPANILFTEYGEPALTDFGIARIAGGFETSSEVITGTPAFTAPEVLSGAAPTVASDIYGLGATLFCALTGHAAFERRSGESVVAQFLRISRDPIPDLRGVDIPDPLARVVEQAMAHDPADRPTSAAAFGAELCEIERQIGWGGDQMALRVGVDDGAMPDDAGPETATAALRVLVADDHPVYRDGLARHLNEFDTINVVATACDGRQAISQIASLRPDVAIVDLKLPKADGLEVLEELERKGCQTRVVILTAYVDSATVYRAIAAGASGYLEKGASIDEIRRAIEAVARGETVIAPMVNAALASEIRTRTREDQPSLLTERETGILTLAADGLSTAQIARQLGITQPTVKTHLAHVYQKLDVPDRAAAVAKAFRLGLLS